MVRADSWLDASLYCLPRTCGLVVLRVSNSHPETTRRPLFDESEPNATIVAFAGAPDHWDRLISCGEPGVDCGAKLFETRSNIPAFERSLYSVASNTVFSAGVCGSAPPGLKSAVAMRMRSLPRLV